MSISLNGLTDVLFYEDKFVPHKAVEGFKNVLNVPNQGETVVLNKKCYVVADRRFDFDKNIVRILLKEKVNEEIFGGC